MVGGAGRLAWLASSPFFVLVLIAWLGGWPGEAPALSPPANEILSQNFSPAFTLFRCPFARKVIQPRNRSFFRGQYANFLMLQECPGFLRGSRGTHRGICGTHRWGFPALSGPPSPHIAPLIFGFLPWVTIRHPSSFESSQRQILSVTLFSPSFQYIAHAPPGGCTSGWSGSFDAGRTAGSILCPDTFDTSL